MVPLFLIRASIAAVWLYEGIYPKLLGGIPHQVEVLAAHPLFAHRNAALALKGLGVFEVLMGLWALSGVAPVVCALAQTVLLVGMNTNGLIFSRRFIPDPGGMVTKNFALILLIWVAALHG